MKKIKLESVFNEFKMCIRDRDQKVKTAFLKVGDVKIELLEPTSPESTIAKLSLIHISSEFLS